MSANIKGITRKIKEDQVMDKIEHLPPEHYRLSNKEQWLRYQVNNNDTMIHLALKYDTTIGNICRANRMHWQDVLQSHNHIWLPIRMAGGSTIDHTYKQSQLKNREHLTIGTQITGTLVSLDLSKYSKLMLPPHFYRQNIPNPDDFADEGDPLLITTKMMWTDLLQHAK